MILAGDVGGTNTRLALVEATAGELKIAAKEISPSRWRMSLETAWESFCHFTTAMSPGVGSSFWKTDNRPFA
jgi:glucokinase